MATIAQKSYMAKPREIRQDWHVVNADGVVLGRLASRVATILMGKHKPVYTPHVDVGDFVVVVNAAKIRVTGRKLAQESEDYYTGYPSGHRSETWAEMLARKPEKLIRLAVKRMLPKSKLGEHMLTKLKVYAGAEHPHQAQQPQAMTIGNTREQR